MGGWALLGLICFHHEGIPLVGGVFLSDVLQSLSVLFLLSGLGPLRELASNMGLPHVVLSPELCV